MDIQSRKLELKSELCEEQQTQITSKSVKRPFDVAFLMLPDDKMKKQTKMIKTYEKELDVCYNNNDEDEEIEVEDTSPREYKFSHQKYFLTQKQQIFDDPSLIRPKSDLVIRSKNLHSPSEQKSAFTKVNLAAKDPRLSPSLSMSPDLSYQNSLSPSPPINRTYSNFPTSILSPSQIFKNQQVAYQTQFLPDNFHHATAGNNVENNFFKSQPEMMQPSFAKMRPIYRPDLPYNYQQFHNQELLKMTPSDIRSPAAAILTSLLPPSLAALSLPAQNVCAKCNISFRMTSDLVYHMRSHHKNESTDSHRKRREDKLKCPVCAESFRERHHLTRHMTAHQDKDEEEKDVDKKPVTF